MHVQSKVLEHQYIDFDITMYTYEMLDGIQIELF